MAIAQDISQYVDEDQLDAWMREGDKCEVFCSGDLIHIRRWGVLDGQSIVFVLAPMILPDQDEEEFRTLLQRRLQLALEALGGLVQ